MATTHPARAPQREERDAKIAHRVNNKLQYFQSLPDDALIDTWVVSALLARSRASIWRDVANCRLAQPVRIGSRSTRWRAGDVRAAMKGGTAMVGGQ